MTKTTAYITVCPAYGRDYKSKKAVVADFEAEKDFIIQDVFSPYAGKPINRQQLEPHEALVCYYDAKRKSVILK